MGNIQEWDLGKAAMDAAEVAILGPAALGAQVARKAIEEIYTNPKAKAAVDKSAQIAGTAAIGLSGAAALAVGKEWMHELDMVMDNLPAGETLPSGEQLVMITLTAPSRALANTIRQQPKKRQLK